MRQETPPGTVGTAAARPQLLADRRVALVHEWYSAAGGSEQVFGALAELVPHADRYVLWAEPGAAPESLRLKESWLRYGPLRRSRALALPVMPLAFRTLGRARYDVVLSSSHAFAHTVRFGPAAGTRYLSYIHSPARYLWSPDFDNRGAHPLLGVPRRLLRGLDERLGRHVHAYAANSQEVRERIRRYWGRDATVVHPPVDVDFFGAGAEPGGRDYLLGVGRWVGYKRFDLVIAVAEAAGLPLVLAGGGPEEARLRRLAGASVRFEVRPDRARLRELYAGAQALLFPTHEDFGIVPVEAQACGTPVVGLRRGGLLETVVDGETGFLVDGTDPAGYVAALRGVAGLDSGHIREHARQFSADRFADRMAEWVGHALG